jgi:tetrahydromethanopterin S-methyltransferase subunit C
LFEALAIVASICFYVASNASTKEVHMKIPSTKRQMSMLCAAAAADNRALLG